MSSEGCAKYDLIVHTMKKDLSFFHAKGTALHLSHLLKTVEHSSDNFVVGTVNDLPNFEHVRPDELVFDTSNKRRDYIPNTLLARKWEQRNWEVGCAKLLLGRGLFFYS